MGLVSHIHQPTKVHTHTHTCVRRRARPSLGGNSDHSRFTLRSQAVATSPLTVTPLFFPSARHILQLFSYRPTPVMQTSPLVHQPGGDLRSAQPSATHAEGRETCVCVTQSYTSVLIKMRLYGYVANITIREVMDVMQV